MYDKNGKLITAGLSAGTADRFSPNSDKGSHLNSDVRPFELAEKLDKQFGGVKYREMYMKVRPPHVDPKADKNITR